MTARSFTHRDQEDFARLTGDWNPLHVDPVAARRLLFGECVVHGVHLVSWTLDQLASEEPLELRTLSARFRKPVPVGREVDVRLQRRDDGRIVAKISLDGVAAVGLDIRLGAPRGASGQPEERDWPRTAPRALQRSELVARRGVLPLAVDPALSRSAFPSLRRVASPRQIAQLFALTRLVGMECPGLHSIFASLDLDFTARADSAGSALGFVVAHWDERFSRAEIDVSSASLSGRVTAFVRPAPTAQVSCASLDAVEPGEFARERALVIGGSRGLGEVTAKLLAVGGADVRLTYHRGSRDAQAVADDIRTSGGRAVVMRHDVLDTDAGALTTSWVPTLLAYFASPPIERSDGDSLNDAALARFRAYFVDGFERTIHAARVSSDAPLAVLYPSTAFLNAKTTGFREYVAVKTEGEALCARLEQADRGLVIHRPRLPRLATDQTASLLLEGADDPVPVCLGALRHLLHSRRSPQEFV